MDMNKILETVGKGFLKMCCYVEEHKAFFFGSAFAFGIMMGQNDTIKKLREANETAGEVIIAAAHVVHDQEVKISELEHENDLLRKGVH